MRNKLFNSRFLAQAFLASAILFAAAGNAGTGKSISKEDWTKSPFEQKVFVENKGQFDKKDKLETNDIKYGVRYLGAQLYFTPSGLTYRYDQYHGMEDEEREEAIKKFQANGTKTPENITTYLTHMTWEGANPNVQIIPENKISYYFTYPDLNDATGSHCLKAGAYSKLLYKDLYPGIDVEYFFPGDKSGIKYNIIVHPGADPSVIKMKYSGDHAPQLEKDGNIVIKTYLEDIIDHAPYTYYNDGASSSMVRSSFKLSGNTVSFNVESYDKKRPLIIDPWTTVPTFSSYNAAYDVEFDLAGNCYVNGGDYPFQEIKLNSAGVIQWVYSASSFYGSGCAGPCYGDFAVDGTSGSSYIVEGFNGGSGTRVIKLNNAGTQVAMFPGNNNLGEMWRIVYNNCAHKSVIAGGGTSATYQACVLDTNLTNLTPVNVLNSSTALHDFCLLALDNNNMAYMATARSQAYPTQYDNVMLQAPGGTLSPVNYTVSDNHSFVEVASIAYVLNTTSDANGFNGMCVSQNFLYTYDGATLKKWNKNNGTLVGTVSVSNTSFTWGGLDVDDCDNVYVGVQSNIKKYDVNLTLQNTIATANTVYDLRLGPNNKLYAAGNQFVQEFTLTSQVCNPLQLTTTGSGNCSNGSATVTVTGGNGPYTYSWSTNPVQTTSTATGLSLGNYTVWVTDASCVPKTAFDTVVVTGSSSLPLTTTQTNVLCFGATTGSSTVNVTNGNGTYTYSWVPGNQSNQTSTGLAAGNYTVYVTDQTGCSNFSVVTITQPNVLTSNITPTATICSGACSPISVTASGGTAGYSYSWSTGQTTSSISACPTVTTAYTVFITDNNGCTIPDTATVALYPPFAVQFVGDTLQRCAPLCVNFTNNTANSVSYSWNFGDLSTSTQNNPSHCYTNPGQYNVSLTITDNNGCTSVLTLNNYITVYPYPLADFTMSPATANIINPQICFTDASNGAATWTWDFGDTTSTPSYQQNPCHTYSDTGTFCARLIVTNSNGCPDTIIYCLVIEPDVALYVPNAFTPNADGINDLFFPKGKDIDPNDFKMWIFDRWGNMIWSTSVWGQGWDGRANGGKDIAQEDVYVWKIKCKDGNGGRHDLVGHVTLIK